MHTRRHRRMHDIEQKREILNLSKFSMLRLCVFHTQRLRIKVTERIITLWYACVYWSTYECLRALFFFIRCLLCLFTQRITHILLFFWLGAGKIIWIKRELFYVWCCRIGKKDPGNSFNSTTKHLWPVSILLLFRIVCCWLSLVFTSKISARQRKLNQARN